MQLGQVESGVSSLHIFAWDSYQFVKEHITTSALSYLLHKYLCNVAAQEKKCFVNSEDTGLLAGKFYVQISDYCTKSNIPIDKLGVEIEFEHPVCY